MAAQRTSGDATQGWQRAAKHCCARRWKAAFATLCAAEKDDSMLRGDRPSRSTVSICLPSRPNGGRTMKRLSPVVELAMRTGESAVGDHVTAKSCGKTGGSSAWHQSPAAALSHAARREARSGVEGE